MKRPDNKPLVYLISDGSITNENYKAGSQKFLDLVAMAVSSNIPMIQIREKQLSAQNLFDLAVSTRGVCLSSSTSVLVNDRVDVALAANVDGVHLTSHSVRPEIVRKFVPQDFLVGLSTHSVDELESARDNGADFAVFGPIFESQGKGPPLGLEVLRSAVAATEPFPVLGLGGVDASNYHDILNAGAAGFAAIRFLNDAENLKMLSS